MTFYKIKHKESGWFYQPDRGSGNISKKGKVYQRRPSLTHVTGAVINIPSYYLNELSKADKEKVSLFNIDLNQRRHHSRRSKFRVATSVDEWEVVEIKV